MKIAPFPIDEDLRIKDLESYDILDSIDEKEYDDLVELASQICDCPIALVSLVDKERQWFKAKKQLDATETIRDIAFCSHTILQNEVMIVSDAKSDERFFDNPLVTGELQIGFYAGAPIFSSSGYKLGTVCVIDHLKKDTLTESQKKALKIIAQQVSKLLELRLKNKLIIKHTEAQIKAEKRVSQLTISASDIKESSIAYELHENLAQTLAAVKIYLSSAETSKDLKPYFIKKSIDTIALTITEIRSLSKSIIPTTLINSDYYGIIREYGMQFGKQNNIEVNFGEPTIIISKSSNTGLNLFRIVENQLEISKIRGAKEVSIMIKSDSQIVLEFSYDTNILARKLSTSHLENNIITRVELLNGELTQNSSSTRTSSTIRLPIS